MNEKKKTSLASVGKRNNKREQEGKFENAKDKITVTIRVRSTTVIGDTVFLRSSNSSEHEEQRQE